MKIIIKTGFQLISHDVKFHPSSQPKGQSLVESGHVRDVHEFREDGKSYLIQSNVVRQTSVTSTPYSTKLFINDVRHVLNVTCTCCYNKSKACKHIAALIHFINNKESRSKTDIEQKWGGLTAQQFAKQKYSKGRYFYEMFPPEQELEISPQPMNIAELNAPSPLKIMLAAAEDRIKNATNNEEEEQRKIIDAKLRQTAAELERQQVQNCLKLLLMQFDKQITQSYSATPVLKEQVEFYNKYIVLSEEQIVELCCDTIKQSEDSEWFKARRLRISASKSAHSIKSRKSKAIDKLIGEMLHPQKIDNADTKYGKRMEALARQEYEHITGMSVQQVGVIVCKNKPWLCASLDGVVMQESIAIKIVEIKCPASCKDCVIFDTNTDKPKVNYLKLENNKPVLKSSSIYYTQCQIQMYVSGFNQCDLFVYTPVISYIIPVHRNESFLQDVLCKCENFYFHHYLPALQVYIENETSIFSKKTGERTFTGKDVSNVMLQSLNHN